MNHQPSEQPDAQPQALYITLILDESGSMQSCKGAAIAGFNQYVATLRQDPAETRFTLTLFNSGKLEVRYHEVAVSAVKDLDVETYRPDDGTPLYDAIGRTLSIARQEAPPDARKLCVILTACVLTQTLEHAANGHNVLIHCSAGLGRTALFAALLAKQALGLSGIEALEWLRQCKPDALLTPVQIMMILEEGNAPS